MKNGNERERHSQTMLVALKKKEENNKSRERQREEEINGKREFFQRPQPFKFKDSLFLNRGTPLMKLKDY